MSGPSGGRRGARHERASVASASVTRPDVIRPFVEQTVKAFLKLDKLVVWDDGTIPISAGSTVVRVVLLEGPDEHAMLRFWAPVLQGISATPELLAKLNELNAALSFTRVFFVDGQAVIAMELLAETLDKEQIGFAIRMVSAQADYWDEELSKTFGGKVSIPPGPSHPVPEGSPDEAGKAQEHPATQAGGPAAAGPADREGGSGREGTPGYI